MPLLPGSPTCTVLVTGRRKPASLIDRHGARHLPLDVLARDEARALLAARPGVDRIAAEPEAVNELTGLRGSHPLALAIIARTAVTRPGVPLAEVAAEPRELGLEMLDHDTDPAASLPAVLSWSPRYLTEQQRILFALLGIAPGSDTTPPATAALTDLPDRAARRALTALEDASLLERRPDGRYAMHDLIRAYAADTARAALSDDVREAALVRVTDFYLHTARDAACLVDPGAEPVLLPAPAAGVHPHPLPDRAAALAWLIAEQATLLATQQVAAELGLHRIVGDLARVLSRFHYQRGDFRNDLVAWQTALAAAAETSDPIAAMRAHRGIGFACAGLDRHGQAQDHLHRALALAERHGDLTQQALTHHELATSRELGGDHRTALTHARRALDLYRAAGLPVQQAVALNSVGWYTACLGEFDTAGNHCRAALVLHRRHQNPVGEAHTLDSLGFIAHHLGAHREAIGHHEAALALYRELGNTFYTAQVLGHPHVALGQYERVRAEWREALELYRRQGREADADRVQHQLDDLDGTSRTGTDRH